jgi:predicted PurR-regulated permease PerM
MLNFAAALPGVVLAMIALFIATFFFSRDKQIIIKFWKRILPHPWGERSLEAGREIAEAFLNYVRAQLLLISLSTVLAILGLYMIGAGYAITIGILIGFFDILPVFGPGGYYPSLGRPGV